MTPSTPKKLGRPSKGDRQVVTFRINTADAKKLFRVAEKLDMSVSDLVAENIYSYLEGPDESTFTNDQEALSFTKAS